MTTLILLETIVLIALALSTIKLFGDNRWLRIELKKRKKRLNHDYETK